MERIDDPRQYLCPTCETLTIIKKGMRFCKCYKMTLEVVEKWEEVFLDRINE